MTRVLIPLGLVLLLAACRSSGQAPAGDASPWVQGPTLAEAQAFLKAAEDEYLRLWVNRERAHWVRTTYITEDTDLLAAQAEEAMMEFTARKAREAVRFDKLDLPEDLRRKLKLLKLSQTLPAPRDPTLRQELAGIATEMESAYGKGKYCPPQKGGRCLSLDELSEILAKSRDYDELLDAWQGWRTISPPLRPKFARYVELANLGARELGFADLGDLWKSRYDLAPSQFEAEVDRLWEQVRPLYVDLHCFARARLAAKYGDRRVPEGAPIPAHLLGNMWSQDWSNLSDLLAPTPGGSLNLSATLQAKKVDALEMVRLGEAFFVSLGLTRLPDTFWKRSLLRKPADREVVCHATAWDVDADEDLRIRMCVKVSEEDFVTIHHELGHNYYQYYYRRQPPLFRDSANDGFHEGLGDTIALSVTPTYLEKIGLKPGVSNDLAVLMNRALSRVAFLPFGLLLDKWRWAVFAGQIGPDQYNARYWEMRTRYQGIQAPVPRSERDFDPGAKYHVPANVPYTRYFLAAILQFQFHRALCRLAGHTGPLHRCSIYGNKEVGRRLQTMMEMGISRPWPEALRALTGEEKMDATAILAYFEPLHAWLKEQNQGRKCGW
jgi:peptidyl-dipeptidase A